MKKTTQKELENYVKLGLATDVTRAGFEDCKKLLAYENGIDRLFYSAGVYGINGILVKGYKTGTLYAVTARTAAVMILS